MLFYAFLLCLVAIIVMAIAVVLIYAPFSIEIRVSQEKSIEFKFGHCLPNVWMCLYWLTISEVYYDYEGEIDRSHIIYGLWRSNKYLYINGKETPDVHCEDLHEEEDNNRFEGFLKQVREERYYEEQL